MMPSRAACAAILFSAVVIAGCSMAHGDPWHPKQNPHPVQRYEVIATADAPGPWDSVKGYVHFQIANVQCVPQAPITGARNVPNNHFDFEMTRVGPNTWKGYFYRDALQDDDYFGLGPCKWEASSVGAGFMIHGVWFAATDVFQEFLRDGAQTTYFRKSFYEHVSSGTTSVPGFSAANPQVVQRPDAFFPVEVLVREAAP